MTLKQSTDELSRKLKAETIQLTHEDIVRNKASTVLDEEIPWDGYAKSTLITQREFEMIKRYDKRPPDARAELIKKEGETFVELFLELLVKLNKEKTVQYLLTLIDQLLTEIPSSAVLFNRLASKKPNYPFDPLIKTLKRDLEWYPKGKAASILATLMASSTSIAEENVTYLCTWLKSQLTSADEKDVNNALSALQKFLRKDEFRVGFVEKDGLHILGTLLKSSSSNRNYQQLYQIINCFWLLTYNPEVAKKITATRVIPIIVDILKTIPKEKITRMCLATLRNIMDVRENIEQMIDADILRPLEILVNKTWGDEDIKDDLDILKQTLEKNVVQLSSFDIYKKELTSGNLSWSPVHKSEKFWKENGPKFEEDKYKLLLILKEILDTSTTPLIQCVACYDAGEFARLHPRGRTILQQLGFKNPLTKLMEDKDTDVRKQALMAIQKLMVHNWEYLVN